MSFYLHQYFLGWWSATAVIGGETYQENTDSKKRGRCKEEEVMGFDSQEGDTKGLFSFHPFDYSLIWPISVLESVQHKGLINGLPAFVSDGYYSTAQK